MASDYLWKRPENVNHCIEDWLYIGDKADRDVRAKTRLLEFYTSQHWQVADQGAAWVFCALRRPRGGNNV